MGETIRSERSSLRQRGVTLVSYGTFGFFLVTLPLLPPQFSLFGGTLYHLEGFGGAIAAAIATLFVSTIVVLGFRSRTFPSSFLHCGFFAGIVCYAITFLLRCLLLSGLSSPGILVEFVDALCLVAAFVPMLYWGLLYARLPLRDALVYFGVSFAFGGFLNVLFVSRVFETSPVVVAIVALAGVMYPCLSTLFVAWPRLSSGDSAIHQMVPLGNSDVSGAWTRGHDENVFAESDTTKRHTLRTLLLTFNFCLGLFILVLISSARCGAYEAHAIPESFRLLESLALPCGGVLVAVFFLLRRSVSLSSLMDAYIPMAGAVFLLTAQCAVGTPMFSLSFFMSHVLMAAIAAMAFAALSAVSSRGEIPSVVLYTSAYAGMSICSLLGVGLYRFVGASAIGSTLLFIISSYFVYVTLSALLKSRKLIGDMARSSEEEKGVRFLAPEMGSARSFGEACQEFSSQHNLTSRENEVLLLLSAGHSSPYIAARLYISENTVRTHMRNMYRKLGVSSKEELVQLLEKEIGA